jgi:hypothetical protein
MMRGGSMSDAAWMGGRKRYTENDKKRQTDDSKISKTRYRRLAERKRRKAGRM